jgi:undecaprenyl pyrophosphate phosphatase UppP
MIFLSTGIISAILIIYLIDIFGGFKYVYENSNKNRNIRHFIDALIIIVIIGIDFYLKAYAGVAEMIFFIVVVLIIVYLLQKKEKKKRG